MMGPILPLKHHKMATLIRLDRCSATTTLHRADFTRTSQPLLSNFQTPMVIPRSAWARAGASFTPSPTLGTQKGPLLRRSRAASKPLALGSTELPAVNSPWRPFLREVARYHVAWLHADLRATARGALLLSLVSITTSLLTSLSALMVDLASGFPSAIAPFNKMPSFTATYITNLFLLQKALAVVAFGCLFRCFTHGTNSAQPSHADANGASLNHHLQLLARN